MRDPIRHTVSILVSLFTLSGLGCASAANDDSSSQSEAARRAHAHILVSDQYNNRVVEIDGHHNIVWSFGDGSTTAGPTSVVAPNDAERIGDYTLIAGTGAPAGAEPGCENGCADNRVILVDRQGHIVWQYGQAGVTGAGANQLNAPVCATFLPGGNVLITDQGNQRVIEVDGDGNIAWQYGTTGVSGADANQLNNPNSALLLPNGHVLIADENNNRVIEVNRAKAVVWSYGSPADTATLNGAAFASRLPNGHTLISDANNNRIVEVDAHGTVVFSFSTSARTGSVANPNPTRAVRLRNGDTLISDQNNHQVIEIDHTGKIVFSQGAIGVAGKGPNQLNGPYDAKVIGDFTGLTSPFGTGSGY